MIINALVMCFFFWLVWLSNRSKPQTFIVCVLILAVLAWLESQGLIAHE